MKSFLLILTFVGSLNFQSSAQKIDSSRLTRLKVLSELKKFKIAFASTDKTVTKKYFQSLINDSVIQRLSDDAALDSEGVNTGTSITRKMVEENFVGLYKDLNLDEFKKLFRYISLDSLSFKDKITYEKFYESQGCNYVYEIIIDKNEVQIIYGTNTNEDYANRHSTLPMVCGEHSYIWTFAFNEKHLYFKKLIESD